MTRRFIGVRWWLGAAFAVVAATSTAIVVSQYSSRSEHALRVNATDAAQARTGVAAGLLDEHPVTPARAAAVARRPGRRRAGYDASGRLLAGRIAPGTGTGVFL